MTVSASPEGPGRGRRLFSFRRALTDWYRARHRDLPWRRTRDPYAIWVSEIMLQQTTVKTVEPRWLRFLEKYPDVTALAAAPVGDVVAEWTGLGYYARARNLHAAARRVAEDFGGRVPESFELLLALPGMGRYTAAAVASIAFEEPVAAVDANVERVIARLEAIGEDIRSAPVKRAVLERAGELVDRQNPGDWTQAMMELGALVCLPRAPQCPACPVRKWCAGRASGQPEAFPRKAPRAPMEAVREAAAVLRRGGSVLVLRRPEKGSFAGMWETPRGEAAPGEAARDAAVRILREQTGIRASARRPLLKISHVVMRRKIELHVWELETEGALPRRTKTPKHEEAEWLDPAEWLTRPMSVTQKQVAELLAGEGTPKGKGPSPKRSSSGDTPDLFTAPEESP